jgi:hypothetical protein
MKLGDACGLALSLPEAVEQDHHGFPSFRVRGKIYATQPDDRHFHVMVDEAEIRAAASEWPRACEELWWGKRLSAVRVDLRTATKPMLSELLTEAWRRKAPKTLVRAFDAEHA